METSLLVYRSGSMTESSQSPLLRSFERHLRAENRSARTIATYLVGLRQADPMRRIKPPIVGEAPVRRRQPRCPSTLRQHMGGRCG